MSSRRIRRSPEAARAEILAAAESALIEVDVAGLTVDLLMRRTGMTRSAFYHYFSGLEEVVVGILERYEADIHASVDPVLNGEFDGDPQRAIFEHFTGMFRVFEHHRHLIRPVLESAGAHQVVYARWQTRVVDVFVRMTESFIRREVLRGRSRVQDPARVASALVLMNNAVAADNLRREKPDTPEALARVTADVWGRAIFTTEAGGNP